MKPRPKATEAKRARKGAEKRPDPVASVVASVFGVLTEVYKLVREMLVIPAQLWMTVAEVAGAVVLRAWRRLRPRARRRAAGAAGARAPARSAG